MGGAISPFPNKSSWRGAQLNTVTNLPLLLLRREEMRQLCVTFPGRTRQESCFIFSKCCMHVYNVFCSPVSWTSYLLTYWDIWHIDVHARIRILNKAGRSAVHQRFPECHIITIRSSSLDICSTYWLYLGAS